jgi:hypothetical protein
MIPAGQLLRQCCSHPYIQCVGGNSKTMPAHSGNVSSSCCINNSRGINSKVLWQRLGVVTTVAA